jgi:hypothetical protein
MTDPLMKGFPEYLTLGRSRLPTRFLGAETENSIARFSKNQEKQYSRIPKHRKCSMMLVARTHLLKCGMPFTVNNFGNRDFE